MVARTDLTRDPRILSGLLLARRGQAYFSRKLNELSDAEFDEPSLLPDWSRRHVIAHVGLNARALTRLTEWAATGTETPMYSSPTERNDEIAVAATLPPQALRNLSDHAAIHLNVEWRDLQPEAWSNEVRTIMGRVVPVSETVWMRTREVWIHAVDLGNGATFRDFPPELLDALLADVQASWARRADAEGLPRFVLAPDDRPSTGDGTRATTSSDAGAEAVGNAETIVLSGPAFALAQWATGRGGSGVSVSSGGEVPAPLRWL
jgi:maleylpyruvate isomerase